MKILKTVLHIWYTLIDFTDNYVAEENINKLMYALNELSIANDYTTCYTDRKITIVSQILYDSILDSTRKYPKNLEKIKKGYMKIIPYIYALASRSELSKTTFDAKRVANVIKEILFLKKDELDKVDGGLPVI